MPLLGSRKLPKAPVSYRRELGRNMKALLTGGAVAVVLAVVTLLGYLWGPIVIPGPDGPLLEFRMPPSVAVVGALLVFCWVQYRMWVDLRDQLQQVTAPLYRYHPETDAGIDVQQVRIVKPTGPGMGAAARHLEVSGALETIRSRRLLVTCDGPYSRATLEYQLRPEECQEADLRRGVSAVTRGICYGKTVAPNSFQVDLPADREAPLPVSFVVYGADPPAVVAIEWL